MFTDIGHSSFATGLAEVLVIWRPSPTSTRHPGGEAEPFRLEQRPSAAMRGGRPSAFDVHMKRDRYHAERLLLRHGAVARLLPLEHASEAFLDEPPAAEQPDARNSPPSSSSAAAAAVAAAVAAAAAAGDEPAQPPSAPWGLHMGMGLGLAMPRVDYFASVTRYTQHTTPHSTFRRSPHPPPPPVPALQPHLPPCCIVIGR